MKTPLLVMNVKGPRYQRGVSAVLIGLTMVLMIGMAGLSLDLGRMYVNKSELQTAADACALAASSELTCDPSAGACGTSFLTNAQNAGLTVGNKSKKNFQTGDAGITASDVTFSTTLNGAYLTVAEAAPPDSRFVKCTARMEGIMPWFMRIVGIGAQTVSARAVATLAPGQTANAVPLGICAAAIGSPPNYGMTVGQWYGGLFTPSGAGTAPACSTPAFVGAAGCSGSYNWIDFTPPSGGGAELSGILSGTGQYSLPPVGTLVGQSGFIASLSKAYNTRFGLYTGTFQGTDRFTRYPPDHSGYGYTPTNWPSCFNALGGTPGSGTATNYYSKRAAHAPYGVDVDAGNAITGLTLPNPYNPIDDATALAAHGKDRRLVVSPIVDCNAWCGGGGSNTVPVLGYACIFLLQPMDGDTVRLEYRGRAGAAGSPCSTAGIVGPADGTGPRVPALVQ
jgi:Putative Flp pilus-assembly TadE/G-like